MSKFWITVLQGKFGRKFYLINVLRFFKYFRFASYMSFIKRIQNILSKYQNFLQNKNSVIIYLHFNISKWFRNWKTDSNQGILRFYLHRFKSNVGYSFENFKREMARHRTVYKCSKTEGSFYYPKEFIHSICWLMGPW